MAKISKSNLKHGVDTYSGLHAAGQHEAEVKAAIAADEKGFDEAAVNDIYAAITAPAAENAEKTGSHFVVQEFRDQANFDQVHRVGSDVSSFDAARLETLVNSGLVEKK